MPVKSLPPNPSLEHLKYQARDLLNALSQGNAQAIARVREFHPKFARVSDDEVRLAKFSLANAQLVIAREYGFESWPKLKRHVEVSAQTAGSVSSIKPPAGPVELKEKWASGAHIVRETELKQTSEINIPGIRPVKSELSLASQHACTAVKELLGGGREVELEHLSFRFEINSRGWLYRYDSARSSEADQPEVANLFEKVLCAKVRCFLDANSHVERMEGADELVKRLNFFWGAKLKPDTTWDKEALDKVLTRIRPGEGLQFESITWGLKSLFDEDYFKSKLERRFLPDKAVQPGDIWTFSRKSRKRNWGFLNMSVQREGTVTFSSWDMRAERLCARLEFHGTEKMSPEKNGPQAGSETARGVGPVGAVTEGTFSGVVWFDPELGRVIEVNVNNDFKVTSNKIAIPSPSAKPAIQVVADHYHQVITERLVEGS